MCVRYVCVLRALCVLCVCVCCACSVCVAWVCVLCVLCMWTLGHLVRERGHARLLLLDTLTQLHSSPTVHTALREPALQQEHEGNEGHGVQPNRLAPSLTKSHKARVHRQQLSVSSQMAQGTRSKRHQTEEV